MEAKVDVKVQGVHQVERSILLSGTIVTEEWKTREVWGRSRVKREAWGDPNQPASFSLCLYYRVINYFFSVLLSERLEHRRTVVVRMCFNREMKFGSRSIKFRK